MASASQNMTSPISSTTAQGATTPSCPLTFFVIAGEASGDLHAANLIAALAARHPGAKFYGYGGGEMERAGATLLCNYKDIAYMGFIPVLLHLRTIMGAMTRCKRQIETLRPDVVLLVDYPGFNMSIAKYVKRHTDIPVYYYISPKIWAWREGRIKGIRRYVDEMFCILPFEVDFFKKHAYPVHYVGNPTVDEVEDFKRLRAAAPDAPCDGNVIALLAGSRRQEIKDNLRKMCLAARPFAERGYKLVVAGAPSLDAAVYERHIPADMLAGGQVEVVNGRTYDVLSRAAAALVTSGTATLETALFGVPQVVCYYIAAGKFISFLRRCLLHVPYISLVNLVAGREVVRELVADGMTVDNVRRELSNLIDNDEKRAAMLDGYRQMAEILGPPGSAAQAAREILACLKSR